MGNLYENLLVHSDYWIEFDCPNCHIGLVAFQPNIDYIQGHCGHCYHVYPDSLKELLRRDFVFTNQGDRAVL